MQRGSTRIRAQAVAMLAALQPGIEPVALELLAANRAVDPADFGWIVGAGQIGMAVGALVGWLGGGSRTIRPAAMIAIGAGATLGLAIVHGLVAVMALRLMLGIVMGALLAQATARAARERPHQAIGTIYLSQQLLSTMVLAGLPVAAAAWGPASALATLVAVPLAIALLLGREGRLDVRDTAKEIGAPILRTLSIDRDLASMALLFAVTMMVWSYVGTIGRTLGLPGTDIGWAIALGSLASAPAAALAAFSAPRLSPWLTAAICGAGMLTPLVLPNDAGLSGYLAALIAFNAGSTFVVIRFSGWAMARRGHGRERRFVALVQCAAMAGGPALGAIAMRSGGLSALGILAGTGLVAATLLPAVHRIDRLGYRRGADVLAA